MEPPSPAGGDMRIVRIGPWARRRLVPAFVGVGALLGAAGPLAGDGAGVARADHLAPRVWPLTRWLDHPDGGNCEVSSSTACVFWSANGTGDAAIGAYTGLLFPADPTQYGSAAARQAALE